METAASKAMKLEGTWELTVTLRSCETGTPLKSFRAMSTFSSGGAVIETSASDVLPTGGLAQGYWRHIGGTSYAAVIKLFRFKRDGTFAGIERVTRNIALGDDGNEFSATASVQVFDPDDRLVRTGCATAMARRLQ